MRQDSTRGMIDAIETALVDATKSCPERFRSNEFRALAYVVVAAAPTLDLEGQLALTKLGVWICGVDDVIDDPAACDTDIARQLDRYDQLVNGVGPAFDPIEGLLVDVIDMLESRARTPALLSLFVTQVMQALAAMWSARTARASTISLDAYLENAAESIFAKPVATAAAILFGDPSIAPAFLTAEQHMATAIRIVNDRTTRGREAHELSINAYAACGATDAELEARLAAELRALEVVLGTLPTSPTTAFVDLFCNTMIDVYARGGLR